MRMIGGVLTKARRGELCPLLPIGFVYDDENKAVLDPDQQVQESVRLIFSLFRRTGSAYAWCAISATSDFCSHRVLFSVRTARKIDRRVTRLFVNRSHICCCIFWRLVELKTGCGHRTAF
jgi:hypothetical protein